MLKFTIRKREKSTSAFDCRVAMKDHMIVIMKYFRSQITIENDEKLIIPEKETYF